MAKLFNTISLENRYKSSLNNVEMKQLPEAITMPTDVANTSFRTSINLANRLSQPLLGTTTYLPEYFLSDQHTDYLKIKNFGVYEQTSNIVINPITSKPNQGGVVLNNPNTIINQGGVTINTPTYDSLLLEGTSLSNGVYTSKTNITPSISVQNASVLQGLGTNPTPSISSDGISMLQGFGTNPTLALATEPIRIPSSIVLGQPTQVEPIKTPLNLIQGPSPVGSFENVPSNIVTGNSKPVDNQGGITPTPFNYTPNRDTPILSATVYEADRALAYFTPTIKHGSTDAQKYTSPNNSNNVIYPDVASIDGGSANSNIAQVLGSDDNNRNDQKLDNILTPVEDIPGNNTGTKSSLSDYTTLTYDQIVKRSVDVDNKYKVEDFREGILGVNQKNFIGGKTPSKFIAKRKKSTENAKTDPSNDFILFQVQSLVDKRQIISFRAFITSFNDSFAISWNDVSYIGKQDVLKTFKNTTRTGNIGFKIAAFNREELFINYTKLSDFVKIAAVGRGGVGDTYITGPLCQLTVGRWFKNTPCIFGSVKFDTQPTEYSWEIDGAEVPHVVDVTVDFTVLGDVEGKPLNASTNNYFDYIK
jgi:hypothetical protein